MDEIEIFLNGVCVVESTGIAIVPEEYDAQKAHEEGCRVHDEVMNENNYIHISVKESLDFTDNLCIKKILKWPTATVNHAVFLRRRKRVTFFIDLVLEIDDKMMMGKILEFVGEDEASGVNQFLEWKWDIYFDDLFD